jgi:hypothetical protein
MPTNPVKFTSATVAMFDLLACFAESLLYTSDTYQFANLAPVNKAIRYCRPAKADHADDKRCRTPAHRVGFKLAAAEIHTWGKRAIARQTIKDSSESKSRSNIIP